MSGNGQPKRGPRPGRRPQSQRAPKDRAKHATSSRQAAFDLLRRTREGGYANLVLPSILQRHQLSGSDAAFATELGFGAIRLHGRYDPIIAAAASRELAAIDPDVLDVLRLGAHQLLDMRVPDHAAVSESVALARGAIGAGPAQFVNAVLRRIAERSITDWLAEVAPAPAADPTGYLSIAHSHPAWIVRALRSALRRAGRAETELADLLAADNTPARVVVAARPGLIEAQTLLDQAPAGSTLGRWAPTAVQLSGGRPDALPAIAAGLAGVQDEGSQLAALALASAPLAGPDATWLDMCAGPGGKAALLAALAAERGGHLLATEALEHRCRLVGQSVRALSDVVEIRHCDARRLPAELPAAFDRVLLDAPCTGLGALRRRPEARWRRHPSDLADLGALQRELLTAALALTRPGGVIGYVTCSPHPAETDLVLTDVLSAGDAELIDSRQLPALADIPDARLPNGATQLWPHLHQTDAMFISVIRRH